MKKINWEDPARVLVELCGLVAAVGFGAFVIYAGLLTGGWYILLGAAIGAACITGAFIEMRRFARVIGLRR